MGTSKFDCAFTLLIGHEGGLSRDRRDRGNWTGGAVGKGELRGTKYGISAATYPKLDIAALTIDEARAIYRRDYWDRLRCDELPATVALVVFDGGVNAGPKQAAKWLQRAVGTTADGVIGPKTLAAVARLSPLAVALEVLAYRNVHNGRAATATTHALGWSRRLFNLARLASALEATGSDDFATLFP